MSSIFADKSDKPNNQKLSEALGASYKYWEKIRESLEDEYGKLVEEWKYYGASSGWTLKMLLKKRNLFFFTPCDGYFRISFVFGDRAVAAIEESDLPPKLIQELKNAKRYAEGRGLRIEVKKRADIDNIVKLVAVKVDH